jgi:hypothetical protein
VKKSVFRKKYVLKEVYETPVVRPEVKIEPVEVENEKSSILEVGTIKVSRRKKGDE